MQNKIISETCIDFTFTDAFHEYNENCTMKSAQGDFSQRTDSRTFFSIIHLQKMAGGKGGGEIYSPEKGLFLSANNQLSLTCMVLYKSVNTIWGVINN
jgi:hypothetical protein